MSYVLGAWDSRWGYGFGGLGAVSGDVSTNWATVRNAIWGILNAPGAAEDPNYFTNMNAALRLDVEFVEVLNETRTPQAFSAACKQTLTNISAPQEAFGAANALAYVTKETLKDVKKIIKTSAEDLAKHAGEIIGKAAAGAVEGAGVPEWLVPLALVMGVGGILWWKLG